MKDKKLYTIIVGLIVIILVLIVLLIKQNINIPKNIEHYNTTIDDNTAIFNIDGCLTVKYDEDTLTINLGSDGKYVKTCVAYELGEKSNKVKHIVVEDGVTAVFALEDSQNKFSNLETVSLSDTVVYFEDLQNYTFEAGN